MLNLWTTQVISLQASISQWYESLQDFNDYFDTRLDLANWKESVQQAKEIIAENMQCFDCNEEQYLIDQLKEILGYQKVGN